MSHPLSKFHDLYDQALRHQTKALDRDASLAVQRYKDDLDVDYEYMRLREEAIEQRRITLLTAGYVALCLAQQNIRPEIEIIDEEPVIEVQGLLRKKSVQVGVRKRITLEGWYVLPKYTGPRPLMTCREGKILLTPDKNLNNHPPLVWHPRSKTISRDEIQNLSRTPLSAEDMPWPKPTPKMLRTRQFWDFEDSKNNYFITPEVSAALYDTIQAEDEDTHIADYELYERSGIEEKLQVALAELAAKYNAL